MWHTIKYFLFFISSFFCITGFSQSPFHAAGPRFTTDGFFKLPNNNTRQVFNFNNGWLYHEGNLKGAGQIDFADSTWQEVQLPHGIDILHEFVSGEANYQGIVWYRKHFTVPSEIQNKKISITFEAIMGKSDIHLNGHLIKEHKDGYLPIVLDLSASGYLNLDRQNVITVVGF